MAVTTAKSWADAEAHCEGLGGHLAVIRDADDNAAVVSALNAASATGPSWIGLHDSLVEGSYAWELGPLNGFDLPLGSYQQWDTGHPQTDAECGLAYCDCADLILGSGKWRVSATPPL